MKKIYGLMMLLACATACQNKEDLGGEVSGNTREVTVSSLLSKTTIDYEGDVSHLVWSEGDNVMYLTNNKEGLDDYGFMSAVVKDNSFTATIPASATSSDKILVAWPSKAMALGSSETRIWMDDEFTVSSTDPFDGKTLPMVALVNVPEGKEVSASYRPLGSVLRIAVDTTGHASERLKSIKLTTAENCVGSFNISPNEEGGASFKGNSNVITVKLSDTPELRNFNYVYMVLAKGSYTGVKMEVETELSTYTFEDGKMDLSAEDRGLFRVTLTLPAYEEPKEECFSKVTSQDQITADAKYLILSPKSDTEYYVPSSKKDNDYLRATTVTAEANGTIAKSNETEALAVVLLADENHSGKFAIRYDALGKYKYLQHPANITAGVEYKGFFWFEEESLYATSDNCWWTVSLTDGKVVFKTNELLLWGEPTGRYGEISYFKNDDKFGIKAPELDPEEYADLVLFKLQ